MLYNRHNDKNAFSSSIGRWILIIVVIVAVIAGLFISFQEYSDCMDSEMRSGKTWYHARRICWQPESGW